MTVPFFYFAVTVLRPTIKGQKVSMETPALSPKIIGIILPLNSP